MKNVITLLIVGASLALFVWLMPTSTQGVNAQIQILCQDNPDKDCKAIDAYCRESLEKGFDCLITD
jgi:hypothetical protein